MASYTDVCTGEVWDDDIDGLVTEVEYWKGLGNDIEFYITNSVEIPDDTLHFGNNAGRIIASYVVKADRQLWRRICSIVGISF